MRKDLNMTDDEINEEVKKIIVGKVVIHEVPKKKKSKSKKK
jgi:hypothetical protein